MISKRFWSIIILALGALLGVYVSAGGTPFKLGLDLSGGTHLVYRADTSRVASADLADSMAALRDVIERRVNVLGVSEPIVQNEQSGIGSSAQEQRLIVELPGFSDVQQAVAVVGQTPVLEFKIAAPKTGTSTAAGETYVPTGLTGRYLKHASVEFDQTSFAPSVSLEFNSDGAKLFADLTRANVGRTVAIYLDGAPISTPVVREPITDGRAQITGNFTAEEAKLLVGRLNSGALPVPIELLSTQTIGASLGEDALARDVRAGLFAFLVVALFLLLWYRLPGLLAVLALSIYVALMLAIFKAIPVVLTAAGIAGFILSIGMAVDANILIFERLKEELRSGKPIEAAVREGFARAWFSIRDSNVSSMITAFVLFWLGTSSVQGFALVFGLGVLVSMFTAITVTRTFLSLLPSSDSPTMRFLYSNGFSFRQKS